MIHSKNYDLSSKRWVMLGWILPVFIVFLIKQLERSLKRGRAKWDRADLNRLRHLKNIHHLQYMQTKKRRHLKGQTAETLEGKNHRVEALVLISGEM